MVARQNTFYSSLLNCCLSSVGAEPSRVLCGFVTQSTTDIKADLRTPKERIALSEIGHFLLQNYCKICK